MKGVFLGNMHVVVVHTEEPRLCDRAILGVHATPCSASGHGLVKLLELERKAMYVLAWLPTLSRRSDRPGMYWCVAFDQLPNLTRSATSPRRVVLL